MAGIDHTIIAFKNGKLLKNLGYFENDEWERWVSNIPFDYNRDGAIIHCELDDSRAFPECHHDNKILNWIVTKILGSIEQEFWSWYKDDEKEIILFEGNDYNVTYYFDKEDTYVLLGGYGHYNNPYTHFYKRGYGEEFERKMARECYQWLCEDVLEDYVRIRFGIVCDEEEILSELRDKLKFKKFWDMTKEESEHWDDPMEYYEE